ncbi:SigE family RNA polymerase sigma factor [Streptomyces sp. NPDC004393]|uniref:SigE family RNA polymerase sigma factor n=1 Tax=Streptomyces sp. NPDC004533 TaxID=3154278 RepID=UPI0033A8909E
MPQYETSAASAGSPDFAGGTDFAGRTEVAGRTEAVGGRDFASYAAASWARLVRTASLLTGDFHEAEDLVQTTLAKVYARWGRIPLHDVDFYVRRSLVDNNLGRIRRRRVAHLLMPFLPERVHQPQAGPDESVERRAAVMAALAALSARQRTVLVLRYWEDLGEAEIAELLGCSLGTVKTHVRRGLAALRAHPAFEPSDRPRPVSGARP